MNAYFVVDYIVVAFPGTRNNKPISVNIMFTVRTNDNKLLQIINRQANTGNEYYGWVALFYIRRHHHLSTNVT